MNRSTYQRTSSRWRLVSPSRTGKGSPGSPWNRTLARPSQGLPPTSQKVSSRTGGSLGGDMVRFPAWGGTGCLSARVEHWLTSSQCHPKAIDYRR